MVYSNGEKQLITMPKRNADFRVKTLRSAYIYNVAKSLGFSFGQENKKLNQKLWLRA
jgi:hypothetical protein